MEIVLGGVAYNHPSVVSISDGVTDTDSTISVTLPSVDKIPRYGDLIETDYGTWLIKDIDMTDSPERWIFTGQQANDDTYEGKYVAQAFLNNLRFESEPTILPEFFGVPPDIPTILNEEPYITWNRILSEIYGSYALVQTIAKSIQPEIQNMQYSTLRGILSNFLMSTDKYGRVLPLNKTEGDFVLTEKVPIRYRIPDISNAPNTYISRALKLTYQPSYTTNLKFKETLIQGFLKPELDLKVELQNYQEALVRLDAERAKLAFNSDEITIPLSYRELGVRPKMRLFTEGLDYPADQWYIKTVRHTLTNTVIIASQIQGTGARDSASEGPFILSDIEV